MRASLAAVAVGCAAFAYFYGFRRYGWFMADEGVLYYQYWRTFLGQLPYVDFDTGYTPLSYHLHALWFALTDVSIVPTRVLMAVINSLTAAGLFLVSCRFVPPALAFVPAVLFGVSQPGDILNMDYHSSPYPTWHAMTLTVWGTWAALRATETSSRVQRFFWLVTAGMAGALAFLFKQNAGIFFLWGLTAGLLSGEGRSFLSRALRRSYQLLVVTAALALVHRFFSPAVFFVLIAPLLGLLVVAEFHDRATNETRQNLFELFVAVGIGFLVAALPCTAYYASRMGLIPFFKQILFVGKEVDLNLYRPLPPPEITTTLLGLAAGCYLGTVWLRSRTHSALVSRALLGAGVVAVVAIAALAWRTPVFPWLLTILRALVALDVQVIVNFTMMASQLLDNALAYFSGAAILGAVVMLACDVRTGSLQARRSALLLWLAACTFLAYYPRMDAAHLYAAAPLVYVACIWFLTRALARVHGQLLRGLGSVTATAFLALFIGVKLAPRLYSFVQFESASGKLCLVFGQYYELQTPRADLFFPGDPRSHAPFLEPIKDLVAYLRETTAADEKIFAVPALPMVYFLAERQNATRYDYLFGQNTRITDQLDMIRTLEHDRVRTVVFSDHPADYFAAKSRPFIWILETYLLQAYYEERRIGGFKVLRRYGSAEKTPVPLDSSSTMSYQQLVCTMSGASTPRPVS